MSKKQPSDTDPKTVDAEGSEENSFLSRWSRLKSEQALKESEAEAVKDPSHTDALAESSEDSPVLTDEDMPPIESLDENSDYSMFMSKGVSENLRRMALRKLFSGTVFNVRDGLDDYDDDFTTFESLGDLVTSDMKHREDMKEKIKERELEEKQQTADDEEASPDLDEAGIEPDREDDSHNAEAAAKEQSPDSENANEDDPQP